MLDKHYFLGIDLGTSAVKLVLIDQHKQPLWHKTLEYVVSQPQFGWREINPSVWFDCLAAGLEEVFRHYAPECVDAIGVSGQMHTLVMLDKHGESLRPALMWDDSRTSDILPALRERIAALDGCAYIARTISTGSPAANLYWLRQAEPEHFQKLRKFLIAPDYLVYRLTGRFGTDYCEASTSCLYDIPARQWSEPMRALMGLDPGVYPEVRGSAIPAGVLQPEIADRFSMRRDVRVLTGTGDNAATAISTGCLGQGYPVISLGTSGVLMFKAARLEEEAKGKIILISLDGENFTYLIQGALQSNGTAFEWWNRDILGIRDFSQIDALLEARAPRENGLLFFPHLMGEKTVFADPSIRGAFLGLTTSTTREDMIFAVIEGLCYGYRELAESMKLDLTLCRSIKLVGGGSRSAAWAQIMSNVLNVPIEQMDGNIGAGFGIALLAACQSGFIGSSAEITRGTLRVHRVFYPQPDAARVCARKFDRYTRIYQALKIVYDD